MNIAIILAGGIGSRMKEKNVPKQYQMVGQKPVISYCLNTFEEHQMIDKIIIVADTDWHSFIEEWMRKGAMKKFAGFAAPGRTRQHSIFNGLKKAKEVADKNSVIIIHDAARPMVSTKTISDCLLKTLETDGAMPVISAKDTMYISKNGKEITGLLNRDEIYAGQSPESFKLDNYLQIHEAMTDQEIGEVRGSSEIAFKSGMKIGFVEGDEGNFKITSQEDMNKFVQIIEGRKNQ